MKKLLISLANQNVTLSPGGFSFARKHAMRFQWIALLAYRRTTQPPDEGWVRIEEVGRLPLWRGRRRHHIGTNVGRYIQELARKGLPLVDAQNIWAGPYRLNLSPWQIEFDIPLAEVSRSLAILEVDQGEGLQGLLQFTHDYSRSYSLIFKGNLSEKAGKLRRRQLNARRVLLVLAANERLKPSLRLLACLTAARVYDRISNFETAGRILDDCAGLAKRVADPALRARWHLASAWRFYRAGKRERAEQHIDLASTFSASTTDRTEAGAVLDRNGIQLSSEGDYEHALLKLSQGLEARLPTGNFDLVQASCFNIGNVLHRMGRNHYAEANRWIRLCLKICDWMQLGRDEAIAESTLAKIALEQGRLRICRELLQKAEALSRRAGNALSICECHIVRSFYFAHLGSEDSVVDELVAARRIYLAIRGLDTRLRDAYLAIKFAGVWKRVLAHFRKSPLPVTPCYRP